MADGALYATLDDIRLFAHALTTAERDKAEALLETACAKLRVQARRYGKDLDAMISADPDLAAVAKETVVQAVNRAMISADDDGQAAVTQGSQSAMGYSVSMTYLNAGQSLYFLKKELKELGILGQKWGAVEIYETENTGDPDSAV